MTDQSQEGTKPDSGILAKTITAELVAAGIDRMFGVPGGGANLELVGAAEKAGISFVLTRGEASACMSASTYGLLRHQVGVAIVTRGPGAASAVNGVAQATLDRSPLLVISDSVSPSERFPVTHQRIDQKAMMRPVTKWSAQVGSGDAGGVVKEAISVARSAPKGAVTLDFDPSSPSSSVQSAGKPQVKNQCAMLERAAAMLSKSRLPVILLGSEAWPWSEAVRAFSEDLKAPIFTTYQARGLVPDSSPYVAGVFTNSIIERPLIERADLILAVGLDSIELIPRPWDFTAPIVSLLPWAHAEQIFDAFVEIVGPIGSGLQDLRQGVHKSHWRNDVGISTRRASIEAIRRHQSRRLDAIGAIEVIDEALPPDAIVTIDAGAHMLVSVPLLRANAGRRILISNGLATMGFAVPAAIGAGLAHRDHPVVAITGDGGLGMVLSELETIARLQLNVTVIVFNDSSLSLIEVKQAAHQGGERAVRYRNVDFAAVAKGLGLPSVRVNHLSELRKKLDGCRGPSLIDIRINPEPYRQIIKTIRG